jgi:tRNA A-37 threonylcarbamoyl transferase component Bud32
VESFQINDLQQTLKKGTFLWIAKDWNNESFKNFAQNIDSQFEKGKIFYNDRNTLAIFPAREEWGLKKDVVVKKFNLRTRYHQFRFRFLTSKAVRSLLIATALIKIGIKTPSPVAVIETRAKNKAIIYSYYVTEYIPYEYSLLDIIRQEDHPYRERVLYLLPFIARDIKKMHDAGIMYNDLHAGNILIKNINSEPEFYYIDLNRARIVHKLDQKKRMKDLSRLKFSPKEQEAFLQHYAPEGDRELLNLLVKMRRKRESVIKFKRKIKNIFK